MDQKAMSRAITRISFEIIERNKGAGNLCIVGIVTAAHSWHSGWQSAFMSWRVPR